MHVMTSWIVMSDWSKWENLTKTRHDDVIKWKHFPRNWPFVREIHRSPVNFPHKGQWRGALMFSLIYAWINDWVNNREAGDLRRQHGHYDVIVMVKFQFLGFFLIQIFKHKQVNWKRLTKSLLDREVKNTQINIKTMWKVKYSKLKYLGSKIDINKCYISIYTWWKKCSRLYQIYRQHVFCNRFAKKWASGASAGKR